MTTTASRATVMTTMSNPLSTLGIPVDLLVREYQQGSLGTVLTLAEGFYKVLTKQYHPDRPSGDADLMISFTEALEELKDPDGLEYYIEDYLEGDNRAQAQNRQEVSQMHQRRDDGFDALAGALAFVNQFEMLQVDTPQSVFVRTSGTEAFVLEVLSPSETRLYRSEVPISWPVDEGSQSPTYRDGLWVDDVMTAENTAGTFVHDQLTLLDPSVRLVGGYTAAYVRAHARATQTSNGSVFSEFNLGPGSGKLQFDWSPPRTTWFVPGLRQSLAQGDTAVLHKNGSLLKLGLYMDASPL